MGEVVTAERFSYSPGEAFYDEALLPGGAPRPTYAELFRRMSEIGAGELADRVAAGAVATGVAFGGERDPRPFHVDPVPRVFGAEEWERLAAGLVQRVRALDSFVADVYGDRAIVDAGVVPAGVIESCDHLEPRLAELPAPATRIGVAGLDVVRGADGVLRVLEDNVRTPSGTAYMTAARDSVAAALPELSGARRPLDDAFRALGRALSVGEASVVLLSDGPSNSAWYEHRRIADEVGLPLVTLADLRTAGGRLHANGRPVDVVYRRTDEDRLTDERGELTSVGAALYEPLRAGTLTCVNGFGTGVADDKLVHAYVEAMVGFYLEEEPLLASVHTYDLGDPDCLAEVLDRLGELVLKPRTGHGGHGVVVGAHANVADLREVAQAIRRDPHDYVAQETIMLSRHPTVIDGRLEPRHVDLRPFVFLTADDATVAPGGLTRVALERGALVVNSSQRGGGKDTWVLW
jgi:carboxylate-amine ligase